MTSVLHTFVGLSLVYFLPGGGKAQTTFDYSVADRPIFCYQCNSGTDRDCLTLQANSTNSIHYKPCTDHKSYKGHTPFCRKIVQTIFDRGNMVRVIRKCGWQRHPRLDCYKFDNADHQETICQCFKDGCNAAPALLAPLAAPLVASAAASYYLLVSRSSSII